MWRLFHKPEIRILSLTNQYFNGKSPAVFVFFVAPHLFWTFFFSPQKNAKNTSGSLECLVNNAGIFYTNADPKPLNEVFADLGVFNHVTFRYEYPLGVAKTL